MKKLLLIMLSGILILACGKQESVTDKKADPAQSEKTYKIGITQIVTHPSLDLAKEGFKKAFEEAGLKAE